MTCRPWLVRRLTLSNDAGYDLVVAVATGRLDTVTEIAATPHSATWTHK